MFTLRWKHEDWQFPLIAIHDVICEHSTQKKNYFHPRKLICLLLVNADVDPLVLSFRFHFYPADPTRLSFNGKCMLFQQLRRDLIHGRLYCSPNESAALGALIVQGEWRAGLMLHLKPMRHGDDRRVNLDAWQRSGALRSSRFEEHVAQSPQMSLDRQHFEHFYREPRDVHYRVRHLAMGQRGDG